MKTPLYLLATLVIAIFPCRAGSSGSKPNIILIYADDLGYGEASCYNPERNKVPTPNINQLAGQGIRFTDAHSSSSVCSPSRYALLTGRYHWRSRLGPGIVGRWGGPAIAPDRLTLPALLRQQGYQTAMSGKWHLGWEWNIPRDKLDMMAGSNKEDIPASDDQKTFWKELSQGHFPSGPLRGYKFDIWEGGHRVPFIVRWPGKIAPGSRCDQLVHQADVLATVAEVLGIALPANAGEDSFSLLPTFSDPAKPAREHAISQSPNGTLALRRGPWKMIFGTGERGKKSRKTKDAETNRPSASPVGHLFNLADDLGETRDLLADKPEIAAELTALMAKLVDEGRSTPGFKQSNDMPVKWRGQSAE